MSRLPEPEAMRLAVVFEETGAYQYKKNKDMDRVAPGEGSRPTGLPQDYEEIFSFGEDDPNDYWDKTIVD